MARKRGRPAGFKMSVEHRTKIANSQVLKRLMNFAEGKEGVDMSGPQVTASVALLKKYMPDMIHSEVVGDPDKPLAIEMIKRVVVDSPDDKDA